MGKKKFKMKKPQRKKKIPAALPSSPAPPWTELPTDVAANILQRLSCVELLESVQKVCTTWRSLCRDPAMWRVIKFSDVDVDVDSCDELEIICRHAVDRSQGQLLDINLEYFGTDELLHYISESDGGHMFTLFKVDVLFPMLHGYGYEYRIGDDTGLLAASSDKRRRAENFKSKEWCW
ncbi:F-box protein SKIP19-like isoform X2 [Henckelia pumila]|uniref:F-box protein SKIP19-like isoform X2 n=1 Tax=Henckelia pumila TaxID=405737 RepID=UPI003C6DE60B